MENKLPQLDKNLAVLCQILDGRNFEANQQDIIHYFREMQDSVNFIMAAV